MIAETMNANGLVKTLAGLKQEQFSGNLLVKSTSREGTLEHEWNFCLFLGRILYATGGNHPVRRWQRNLLTQCPQLDIGQLKQLVVNISNPASLSVVTSWEYQLLHLGVERHQISREQAAKTIAAVVSEVLFDVAQATQVSFQIKPEHIAVPVQLALLDPGLVLGEVQKQRQLWQKTNVSQIKPNSAPMIARKEQLQQQVSAPVYQNLIKLLDGHRTLRELGIVMKRDAAQVTSSLLPFLKSGIVELIELADFPAPVVPAATKPAPESTYMPLIACVDDSPLVCQSMEKILTSGGYLFLGVQDSLRAIATLLSRKPDLIFLDLIMPNTNGYEICTQLRKISAFRDTPIVILTGNDGIIDRVRAKIVGASGFLSKPANADTVLETTRQHLSELVED
ncbi:MAG: response regulator [Chroococcus sp. CMT-3BRIN-NPC107]|jgi:chemotaxis family two-component system response regulator PixG|nr:response regulator [Chroococcus sp. CMT-3BRIN-NPC107]